MTASVTVSEGRIEDISVEYRPIETVYPPVQRASGCMVTAPVELLPGRILEAQSLAVDAVTGATATSNAVFAGGKGLSAPGRGGGGQPLRASGEIKGGGGV